MKDKKHKEFLVRSFKNGKPNKMEQTDRGTVMISDRDREVNNSHVKSTKLWYEEVPEKKPGRPAKEETEK